MFKVLAKTLDISGSLVVLALVLLLLSPILGGIGLGLLVWIARFFGMPD